MVSSGLLLSCYLKCKSLDLMDLSWSEINCVDQKLGDLPLAFSSIEKLALFFLSEGERIHRAPS